MWSYYKGAVCQHEGETNESIWSDSPGFINRTIQFLSLKRVRLLKCDNVNITHERKTWIKKSQNGQDQSLSKYLAAVKLNSTVQTLQPHTIIHQRLPKHQAWAAHVPSRHPCFKVVPQNVGVKFFRNPNTANFTQFPSDNLFIVLN